MTSEEQDSGARLRWGILGTGGIARSFVSDLRLLPSARVTAVGSRAKTSAERFATDLDVPRAHSSYADLVADDDVDVVYVATPHAMHYDNVKLALNAGKPVLCEKAFTVNARQARDLVHLATANGLFLMEAMWMRFNPHIAKIRELIADGAIGEVRSVEADHGQWFRYDAKHRLFNPKLAGGALLDLGVYPISLATMVLGRPDQILSSSTLTPTKVDASDSISLAYSGGRSATIATTLEARTANRACINGRAARIEIDPVWYASGGLTLITRDGESTRFRYPADPPGLHHEAAEVARCLREGLLESPIMPLEATIDIMRIMDVVRGRAGVVLPGD